MPDVVYGTIRPVEILVFMFTRTSRSVVVLAQQKLELFICFSRQLEFAGYPAGYITGLPSNLLSQCSPNEIANFPVEHRSSFSQRNCDDSTASFILPSNPAEIGLQGFAL
jgi:hypothetical protein